MFVSHLLTIVRAGRIRLNGSRVMVLVFCMGGMQVTGQTTATIDIDTTSTIPIHSRIFRRQRRSRLSR